LVRLAFVRQTLQPELSLSRSITFSTELRLGLLWTFKEKFGWDVAIFNRLKPTDEPLLKSRGFDGKNWLYGIKYYPDIEDYDAIKDYDILFLEASPPNMRFHYKGDFTKGDKFTEENVDSSYGVRTLRVIQKFRGTVVYFHHALEFFMPWNALLPEFHEDMKGKKPNEQISPINFRKISEWFKPFENKRWVVFHGFYNSDSFLNYKIRGLSSYRLVIDKGYDIHFYSAPQPHSQIDIHLPINPKPTYDATWIGGQYDSSQRHGKQAYSREEGVVRFFNTDLYKARVVGKWEDPSIFAKAEFVPNTQTSSFMASYHMYNDSYSAILVQSKICAELGQVQTRPTIALHGGSIILGDKRAFTNVPNYVGKEWTVSDASDAAEKIQKIKSMSVEERESLRMDQLSRFPRFSDLDWNAIFNAKGVNTFDWRPDVQRFVDK
jgi:hypothetical protein